MTCSTVRMRRGRSVLHLCSTDKRQSSVTGMNKLFANTAALTGFYVFGLPAVVKLKVLNSPKRPTWIIAGRYRSDKLDSLNHLTEETMGANFS